MTVLTVATVTYAATTDAEITFAQTNGPEEFDETVQPVMTRQQLRVHAETGPPEGFEPIKRQLRLHQGDGQANGQCQNGDACQNSDRGHSGGRGQNGGQGENGRGSGQGNGRGQTGGSGAGST